MRFLFGILALTTLPVAASAAMIIDYDARPESYVEVTPASLYQARANVTGTRAETRPAALANCVEDALIKLSGNPGLAGDKRLAPIEADAETLLDRIGYHDQMEGIPKHDEQGSRDRPYDLLCDFNHTALNKALATLGEKPWLAHRPKLIVFLAIGTPRGDYVLARDGDRGIDQRESLKTAAYKRGIPAALPDVAELAAYNIDFAALNRGMKLKQATRAAGGELSLVGSLIWRDKPSGWVSRWRFAWHGAPYAWGRDGISFDQTFRDGLGGVESLLSGHGAPH